MCSCIRTSRLLLILAVITVSLVLPPNLGVSPASHGCGSSCMSFGGGRQLEGGDSDGSDPDEFGIYIGADSGLGKATGTPKLHPEGELRKKELPRFWTAILRLIWMVRR